jgi:hypothetical protein
MKINVLIFVNIGRRLPLVTLNIILVTIIFVKYSPVATFASSFNCLLI